MVSEKRLIRTIQRNRDSSSADALVRSYYDEIFGYIARQIRNKTDAMDVTQEVFVSMLKTIGHYNHKKAGFRTWLYRIATNKTIDFFRNNARSARFLSTTDMQSLPDDLAFIDTADTEAQLARQELIEQVCAYITTLPSDVQQVFRLKFFGEHTFAQIAELLDMPEATVKTRYYRLLQTLRKEFSDEHA